MNPFKVGDTVRCIRTCILIDEKFNPPKIGEELMVIKVSLNWIGLVSKYANDWWSCEDFELVKSAEQRMNEIILKGR